MKPSIKLIRDNKKAFHDYSILDRFEAGMSLVGTEVKSIREGHAHLEQSYVKLRGRELFLVGMNVAPYSNAAGAANHPPTRPRKLLLHRQEIRRIAGRVRERGFTVVPLRLYWNERGLVKLEIALARGRTPYDKREAIKKREVQRHLRRYRK